MILEKTTGELRRSSERIFNLIEELTGIRPYVRESAWYRAENARGRAFLFMRLVGVRAKRNPPNSLHLAARWDERLLQFRVVERTNWFESQAPSTSSHEPTARRRWPRRRNSSVAPSKSATLIAVTQTEHFESRVPIITLSLLPNTRGVMTHADIAALLETQFGAAIASKKLDTLDPFVTVEPRDWSRSVHFCGTTLV